MEDTLSKKTILVLFAMLLGSFLFVYKGFFANGSNYLEEINQYRLSIYSLGQSNNKTSLPQSTLKRTKLTESGKGDSSSAKSKSRIPNELSAIDNNILELKALILNLNEKHSKIISSIDRINQSTKSIEELNEVIKEMKYIKEQHSSIEYDLDELASNVDKLREHFS